MATLGTRSLLGAAVALAMTVGSQRGFAIELFDFGNTVQGPTARQPVAVPTPPRIYWLIWSSGYEFLGTNFTMAVTQLSPYSRPTMLLLPLSPRPSGPVFWRGGCAGARRTVQGFSV